MIGIVIDKRGKFISTDEAYDYVAGYTAVNDVSERELKVKDSRVDRDGDESFDWHQWKVVRHFCAGRSMSDNKG